MVIKIAGAFEIKHYRGIIITPKALRVVFIEIEKWRNVFFFNKRKFFFGFAQSSEPVSRSRIVFLTVVEDDPNQLLLYSEALKAEGHETMTPDQYDRLLGEMEAHHVGARNAGRPMLLEGGLDWKPMGFSPSDMEFQKTKEAAAREIAVAFGVPPMLLGIPGDATYANYAEANRAFYRLTVLPLATRVAATLSHWLAGFAGSEVVLKPDLDQVPALSAERDAQWARVNGADFLSDAEKRALLGLPERADG